MDGHKDAKVPCVSLPWVGAAEHRLPLLETVMALLATIGRMVVDGFEMDDGLPRLGCRPLGATPTPSRELGSKGQRSSFITTKPHVGKLLSLKRTYTRLPCQ